MHFSGYQIQREIGRGKAAVVYQATQCENNRQIALKVFAPALALDPEFYQLVKKTSAHSARFSHPNVIAVHGAGVEENSCYIAMEYAAGGNLRQRIGHGLEGQSVLDVARQVAQAISYLHSQNCIHGAIRPENILFREDQSVALVDAGLSEILERNVLSATLGAFGSADYLSPEQLVSEHYDDRIDQYALGVVIYECLTGQTPYQDDDVLTTIMRQATTASPPVLPAEHAPFQALLDKLLAKDPEQRFASDRELLAAIDGVANACQDSPDIIALASKRRPSAPAFSVRRSDAGWKKFAAVCATLALAVGVSYVAHPLLSSSNKVSPEETAVPELAQAAPIADAKPAATAVDSPGLGQKADLAAIHLGNEVLDERIKRPASEPEPGALDQAPEQAVVNAASVSEDQSTPLSEIDPQTQQRIAALLADGERQLGALRLTTPADDNAYDTYRQVLALEPFNEQALLGIERIVEAYARLAKKHLGLGNYEKSIDFADKGLAINSSDGMLLTLRAGARDALQEALYAQERQLAEITIQPPLSPSPMIEASQPEYQPAPRARITWQPMRNRLAGDNVATSPPATATNRRLRGRWDMR